jgi:DNA-binding response OmpR family regulator
MRGVREIVGAHRVRWRNVVATRMDATETKTRPTRILIADDDAWMSRMLATVLTRRGYVVETASDGSVALERALAHPPDLIITDALMPVLDGWSLMYELRARPALADIPVIFLSALSSEEDRLRGLRLGADAYITKPFRYEEIDLRISTTLRRAQPRPSAARRAVEACLRGRVEDVGLGALLVMLENERKTGRLLVRGDDRRSAELFLQSGKLVRATLEHPRGRAEDAKCIPHLLRWGAGDFEFLACEVDGPDRLQSSMTHLLLEGARFLDESER